MDQRYASWLIVAGGRVEDPHAVRDRDQLRAFLESRRAARAERPGLVARIRQIVQPTTTTPDPACCPA
jgi:hypothetical protein